MNCHETAPLHIRSLCIYVKSTKGPFNSWRFSLWCYLFISLCIVFPRIFFYLLNLTLFHHSTHKYTPSSLFPYTDLHFCALLKSEDLNFVSGLVQLYNYKNKSSIDIFDSDSSSHEHPRLLGYSKTSTGNKLQTFRKNLLPPYSVYTYSRSVGYIDSTDGDRIFL